MEESSQLARAINLMGGPRPDFEQAERLLTAALAQHPQDATLHARRAEARFERGNLAGAIDDAQESLRLQPDDNAAARLLLVEAAWGIGRR